MNRIEFLKKGLTLSGMLISGRSMATKKKVQEKMRYTSNPNLKTILTGWQGTPMDSKGKFVNYEFPLHQNFGQVIKYMFQRNPQREIKKHDNWQIPVLKDDKWLDDPADKIVWFGHASYFIQLSGIRILIDPVFGGLPFVKRHSELPVSPKKLKNIDYIIISHAHFDHCDKNSLKLLNDNNPHAQILTGLGMDNVIARWIDNRIHTAGWYQQYDLNDGMEVNFLPTRHWSNRGLFDTNKTLWGSFMIRKNGKCIFYGGDSGHGSHYESFAKLFPKIDVAMIGAGAYSPKWFMGQNHQDPQDAVKAFNATGALTFIPFHYGTFDVSDEPLGEPQQILRDLDGQGKIGNSLKILKPGEVFAI